MKKSLPVIIGVIAIGALAFFGGIKFAESQNLQANSLQSGRSFNGGFTSGNGGPGGSGLPSGIAGANGTLSGTRRMGQNGSFIGGEILNKDDQSITVKLQDGGSKIVFLAASTKIVKTTDGSTDDLAVGKNVMVNGSSNSDGSLTAVNIQLRPEMP